MSTTNRLVKGSAGRRLSFDYLGDTLHAVAAMAHRRWTGCFGICERYKDLFPDLPRGSMLDVTSWIPCLNPWTGPVPGQHVRDTLGHCVKAVHEPLTLTLPKPPRQREEPYALMLPHSRHDYKHWLPERWEALRKALPFHWIVDEPPWQCEKARSIAELASLIAHAEICVGLDSGPMHLAAAYGTPFLGLFGITDPVQFGPYGLDSYLKVEGPLVGLDIEPVVERLRHMYPFPSASRARTP